MNDNGYMERLRTALTDDIGPGSMKVYVTFMDGETEVFHNILVPTVGNPITYKEGRVEFESADSRNPLLYTLLNVRYLYTVAE